MTRVVFAPNWLGDAVMALPALADLRRHDPGGTLIVAARQRVAGLFEIVPGVDRMVTVGGGRLADAVRSLRADVHVVRGLGAASAVLLPNSMRTALVAALARVPERCGYRRDGRGLLLTRGLPRARRSTHQVDQYRALAAALGAAAGPREPRLDLPPAVLDTARQLLIRHGWDGAGRLVGFAPGAAYGGAKRWPPDRVAAVIAHLTGERGVTAVIVGGAADLPTVGAVIHEAAKMAPAARGGGVINLAGLTTLPALAGVLALCAAFVSNDSGAMHLAAAVGTAVVAVFGPTSEHETAPVARADALSTVIAGTAWCRPCGLRECPIDHRCLTSVAADRVIAAVSERL